MQAHVKRFSLNNCHTEQENRYPKLYTADIPPQELVSFISSMYPDITRTLFLILCRLQGITKHYIKSSWQLEEQMREFPIPEDKVHVSYNIEKLCPSVSILERSELIKCLLKCKRYLKELTMFSIGSTIKLLRQMFTLTYCVNTMENTMFYIDYIELVSLEKSTWYIWKISKWK